MGELGRISQSCRNLGWQEARENYGRSLTSLAREFPVSVQVTDQFVDAVDAFIGGDEHTNVRFPSEPDRIYKITSNDQFGCSVLFDPHDIELSGRNFIARGNDDPWFYLERWRMLNTIGDYRTRIEGLIAPERTSWLPRICVSQPVLPGGNPKQSEITRSLVPFGFIEASMGSYYSPEQNILLTDAFPRNVRVQNNTPALFDVIASTPSHEAFQWLKSRLS